MLAKTMELFSGGFSLTLRVNSKEEMNEYEVRVSRSRTIREHVVLGVLANTLQDALDNVLDHIIDTDVNQWCVDDAFEDVQREEVEKIVPTFSDYTNYLTRRNSSVCVSCNHSKDFFHYYVDRTKLCCFVVLVNGEKEYCKHKCDVWCGKQKSNLSA